MAGKITTGHSELVSPDELRHLRASAEAGNFTVRVTFMPESGDPISVWVTHIFDDKEALERFHGITQTVRDERAAIDEVAIHTWPPTVHNDPPLLADATTKQILATQILPTGPSTL